MDKSGVITYPLFIDECAAYIGKLRDLYNFNMNEEADRFKRGDRSEYVNILGVKGEMIFAHFLHSQKIPYKATSLLSNKPISSCDIIVKDRRRLDVKTVRSDAPDLLVNKEAHWKQKDIDTYVFIQVTSPGVARYWVFKHGEVSDWQIKNVKYTDAYFTPISDLDD